MMMMIDDEYDDVKMMTNMIMMIDDEYDDEDYDNMVMMIYDDRSPRLALIQDRLLPNNEVINSISYRGRLSFN